MHRLAASGALALALCLPLGARAATAIPTCVEVVTSSGADEPLRRLVESELDRHPSHRAVQSDCVSHLRVELIELGAVDGGGRYLTARINQQVPERVTVDQRGLEPAIERLLVVVLHNDPLKLRGPQSRAWLGDQSQAFVRGRNFYGLETFELFTPFTDHVQSLPGLALSARRETRCWYLGLRLSSALSPNVNDQQSELVLWVKGEIEGAIFSRPSATASLFASLLLGAEYQRFRGPAPLLGPGATGTATFAGFAPGARGGLELFRAGELRMTIFAQISLPAFLSTDPDAGVVDEWLPTVALGAGAIL